MQVRKSVAELLCIINLQFSKPLKLRSEEKKTKKIMLTIPLSGGYDEI